MNLSKKDKNLIRGAIRRAFVYSELRKGVLKKTRVYDYSNPDRPRVKNWHRCPICLGYKAEYQMVVDHIQPVIKVNETLEDLSWDVFIEERIYANGNEENLQSICETCHDKKTEVEDAQRKANKSKKKAIKA